MGTGAEMSADKAVEASFQAMKAAGLIQDFEITVDHKQSIIQRGTVYDVKVVLNEFPAEVSYGKRINERSS